MQIHVVPLDENSILNLLQVAGTYDSFPRRKLAFGKRFKPVVFGPNSPDLMLSDLAAPN